MGTGILSYVAFNGDLYWLVGLLLVILLIIVIAKKL